MAPSDSRARPLARRRSGRARPLAVGLLGLHAGCSDYEVKEVGFGDEFHQAGEVVPADILFVVDDSASMVEEQARLAENFLSFVAVISDTTVDFQLGVTTTDATAAPGLLGPVLSPETPDIEAAFLDQVTVGTRGSRDEQGLQAALGTLNPTVTPGFIRPDAKLGIVVFSDEDDHSAEAASFYVTELRSLAGSSGVAIHSIVGDVPDGCVNGVSAADPGARYLEATALSEGLSWSICDDAYATILTRVAFEISGWTDTFHLSDLPEEESIVVTVDDVEIPGRDEDGWTYSLGDNAIVFHGRAVPRPGMIIRVDYEIAEGTLSGSGSGSASEAP